MVALTCAMFVQVVVAAKCGVRNCRLFVFYWNALCCLSCKPATNLSKDHMLMSLISSTDKFCKGSRWSRWRCRWRWRWQEKREREGVTLHVEQIVEVVVECSEQRNFCEQQISRAEQLRAAANPAELATDLQLKNSTSLQPRKSYKWWQPGDASIIHLTTLRGAEQKEKNRIQRWQILIWGVGPRSCPGQISRTNE